MHCTTRFYTKVLYSEPVQGRSKIILRVKRGRLGSWNCRINTHTPTLPLNILSLPRTLGEEELCKGELCQCRALAALHSFFHFTGMNHHGWYEIQPANPPPDADRTSSGWQEHSRAQKRKEVKQVELVKDKRVARKQCIEQMRM